ncbi:protein of unknown function [Trichlorobacter ammonificans]|uniref:Secreted protein n=1 Tax=Trichlorobacter ammonificans TaxID=2916410 RepID=A0ABN8HQ42_9BACT|nr:protein of unknown function [Trichlorobacter ammonificans]
MLLSASVRIILSIAWPKIGHRISSSVSLSCSDQPYTHPLPGRSRSHDYPRSFYEVNQGHYILWWPDFRPPSQCTNMYHKTKGPTFVDPLNGTPEGIRTPDPRLRSFKHLIAKACYLLFLSLVAVAQCTSA